MTTYTCEQCGVGFERNNHGDRKHRFCSRECFRAWTNENRASINHECERCGKVFWDYPSNIRGRSGRHRRFCSIECRRQALSGGKHYSAKGRYKNTVGYWLLREWLVPDEYKSMLTTSNHVLEHRLIMAQKLGRPLKSYEVVHHINGVKDDNRIENLELHPQLDHNGITVSTHKTIVRLKRRIVELEELLRKAGIKCWM